MYTCTVDVTGLTPSGAALTCQGEVQKTFVLESNGAAVIVCYRRVCVLWSHGLLFHLLGVHSSLQAENGWQSTAGCACNDSFTKCPTIETASAMVNHQSFSDRDILRRKAEGQARGSLDGYGEAKDLDTGVVHWITVLVACIHRRRCVPCRGMTHAFFEHVGTWMT